MADNKKINNNQTFRVLTLGQKVGPSNSIILKIFSAEPKWKTELISRMVTHIQLLDEISDKNRAWKFISLFKQYISKDEFVVEENINFDKLFDLSTIDDFVFYDDEYNIIEYTKE